MSAETNPDHSHRAATGEWLQWGRTSMSAETSTTSIGDGSWSMLQWGRTSMSAETAQHRQTHITEEGDASMGPHFDECGNYHNTLLAPQRSAGFNGAALR